jgi:chromosome segregation ATPase
MGEVHEAPKTGEDVSHLKQKIVELSEEVVELKHIEDDLSGEVVKLRKENKDLKDEVQELHLKTNYLTEQMESQGGEVVAVYKAREEQLTKDLKEKDEEIQVNPLWKNSISFQVAYGLILGNS